jgi:hypothetical protein
VWSTWTISKDIWRQATVALSGLRRAPRALKRPTHDASPIAVRSSFDSAVGDQQAHMCVEPSAQDPSQGGSAVVAPGTRHALLRQLPYQRHRPTDRRPAMRLGDTARRSEWQSRPKIPAADDTRSSRPPRGLAWRQLHVLARAVLAQMVEPTDATFPARLLLSFAFAIAAPYRFFSNPLAESKDGANAPAKLIASQIVESNDLNLPLGQRLLRTQAATLMGWSNRFRKSFPMPIIRERR